MGAFQNLSAATVNTIELRNDVFAANGFTAISPSAPATPGFTGSNIHGYVFDPSSPSTQIYGGTGAGSLDYGVVIGAAGGATGGSFTASTYTGEDTSFSVGYATIYDTEIAALSEQNGGDTDLQRVERNGSGTIIREIWGRTGSGTPADLGLDRGNLGNVDNSHVAYGALIAQQDAPPAGPLTDANNFLNASPNDVVGGTIILEIANPLQFNYRFVAFDFVDLDEVDAAGGDNVVIFVETTDGKVRRFSLADGDINGGLTINQFGSAVDGGISRANPLDVQTTGNGFDKGTTNQGASNGDVTPTGSINRVIIDYQGISGAVGSVQFSDVPEPSSALLALLSSALLLRRRRF